MNKYKSHQVREQISQILWEKWDPIGVNDTPEARSEYDGYVASIFTLLMQGTSDEKIAALLRQHETVNMGLRGSSEEHRLWVVAALRQIDIDVKSS